MVPLVVVSRGGDSRRTQRRLFFGTKTALIASEKQVDRAHREILVIEDEPAIGLALLVAGRKQGWNVHLVETGNEGLALLAEQSIQLVLLDLGLPDMRGLEVLGRIQASRPTLPVLIMTGSRSEHDEALRFGATGFLYKPFGINNFNAAVRRVFELKPVEPPAPAP